ncbi:MAG: MFS transporter [Novosphingobium sp.]
MYVDASAAASTGDHADDVYPSLPSAGAILVCCMLGYALSLLDRQILSLMVDLVKADLQLSDVQLGLLQGLAFAIFYSFLTVPFGVLADRIVRKRLVAAGIAFWSAATIACGFADGFWSLFFARMCVGVGEAVLIPSAYSLISDAFRRDRVVMAASILGFSGLAGAGIAILVGGLVIDIVAHANSLPFGLMGVAPWRIVFGIVGIPGLFVALLFLMLREPARKGALRDEKGAAVRLPLRDTLQFIWRRRRIYLPLYASPVILGTIIYGAISWFPAFLVRNFALSYTDVGLIAGLIQLGGALCGAALGPAIANWMVQRGHKDGHLRGLLVVALCTIIPAIVAPLIPSLVPMLIVWTIAQILLGSYLGVSMAALQLRTPNQMRALNSAICMCLATLIGAGVGAPVVGAIAQYGFNDEKALGYALSILNLVCAPTAALLIWSGLKAHRADPFLYGEWTGADPQQEGQAA